MLFVFFLNFAMCIRIDHFIIILISFLQVSGTNPIFNRAGSVKLEPGIHSPHIPPSYQQSLSSGLPVGMSYPMTPANGLYQFGGLVTTSAGTQRGVVMQSGQVGRVGGMPRVSSIEAELEQLVSSFNYPPPPPPIPCTTSPPVSQGIPSIDQMSPGHSTPAEGVSPGLHHQDYSPASSNSPSVSYHIGNQATPPSHVTTPPTPQMGVAHDGMSVVGSQPLKHLPLSTSYPRDYRHQVNASSSADPSYNTALQNIGHTHSPPIAHMTSPDPSALPLATPSQHTGLSPGQGTKENHSPLTGYHGFPSPPKEAGEYSCYKPSIETAADVMNSLTPSPEDYSSQQTSLEGSSPLQAPPQHQTVLGHYAYDYSAATYHHRQPPCGIESEFHHHIPGISVTFNAHESTV